jgi:hypothetical protein
MIIRGGRNLYPYELEQAIGELPGVRKGCVVAFAAPDPGAAASAWCWSPRPASATRPAARRWSSACASAPPRCSACRRRRSCWPRRGPFPRPPAASCAAAAPGSAGPPASSRRPPPSPSGSCCGWAPPGSAAWRGRFAAPAAGAALRRLRLAAVRPARPALVWLGMVAGADGCLALVVRPRRRGPAAAPRPRAAGGPGPRTPPAAGPALRARV